MLLVINKILNFQLSSVHLGDYSRWNNYLIFCRITEVILINLNIDNTKRLIKRKN